MADELDQTNKSDDSSKANIERLCQKLNKLSDEKNYMELAANHLKSAVKENDGLKSVNSLLTKRLHQKEKELADLRKSANESFSQQNSVVENKNLEHEKKGSEIQNLMLQVEKLTSEVENTLFQNEKLTSELKNVKLQNETSRSELETLMVLYRCSEKEKYIASMKLLDVEENVRKLRNEMHSLQNIVASQNEIQRHKKESNEEKVQRSLDVGSKLNQNEGEKAETCTAQCVKKDEILRVIGKTDKFFEEFEAKFEEKISCLITKLLSCDEQTQVVKKSCEKLKKEKLELLDIMEEMGSTMSSYRKRVDELAKRSRRD